MGLPVKTISDSKIFFTSATLADLDPHVAAQATGGFVLTLTQPVDASDTDVTFLKSFSGGGSISWRIGSPAVNESQSSVAALASGHAVVVYRSTPDATGNSDIRAKFFYRDRATGSFGQEFLVNVGNTTGTQLRPDAAELAYGRIAFAWIDTSAGQIKAAIFDPGGQLLVQNITVSTTPSSQFSGSYGLGLTPLSNGNFAVSWRDDAGISRFRIVTPQGSFGTGDIATAGTGSTDVTELADGRVLLTYYKIGGHFGVILDEDGSSSVAEFQLSGSSGIQSVSALHDGRFMVAYDLGGDVYGRIMRADGTADTAQFRINTDAAGVQGDVHLATLADGRVTVAWEDSRTGGGDIYYTVYDPRESGVQITGTAYADEYSGSRFADTFLGGAGNDNIDGKNGDDTLFGDAGGDVLYGEGGNDRLFGGPGNDLLYGELFTGGAGNDRLDGGLGADTMTGGDGNDIFIVDNAGEKLFEAENQGTDIVLTSVSHTLAAGQEIETLATTLLAGTGAIRLAGNEFSQRINGNNGNNLISGSGGNDTLVGYGGADQMAGGLGNDTFWVDTPADRVIEAAGQGLDTAFTTVSYALAAGQEIEYLATTSAAGTGAIKLTGNEFAQRINGNNGNNLLSGGAGNDLLIGYGGNDTIEGQAGFDTLKGVSGVDSFVFRQSQVKTSGADHIADFGADDFIRFDVTSGPVGALNPVAFVRGANALDANDRFIYHAPSGGLYYDPDGNGAQAKILFAVLDNKFALAAGDIILF